MGVACLRTQLYSDCPLEVKPSGKLDLPGRVGLRQRRECAELPERGGAGREIDRGERRVVECVEQIHPRFEASTLGERKVLAQTNGESGYVRLSDITERRWVVRVPCGKVVVHAVLDFSTRASACSGQAQDARPPGIHRRI
jgi:hypothetical protein